MNLPNKLTLLRTLLIPFFVCIMVLRGDDFTACIIADAIFIVACITDFLDGYIARKNNLVTNFGKFMDPLADKLLVCAALVVLIPLNRLPAWIAIVIISREFIISGFRLVAAEQGSVIAASYWGKFKTTFQMLMLIVKILNYPNPTVAFIGDILMWIALILTIISLIDYLYKNREVMLKGGM